MKISPKPLSTAPPGDLSEIDDRGDCFFRFAPRHVSISCRLGDYAHMAAPMIGGLTTSFLLELLIYPVLYQKLIVPTHCSIGTQSPAVLRARTSMIREGVDVPP